MRLKGVNLLHSRDFTQYKKLSVPYRSRLFTVLVSRYVCHTPVVGFIITKKIGNAVIRNKLRRRIRSIVSNILCGMLSAGYCYIIIPKYQSAFSSFSTLKNELIYCVGKIKLPTEVCA